MDLRQMDYIVAIAEYGSFTAAARALQVAQPSLSHGVRTLEGELGVTLFVRLGRGAAPTAAGERVIEAARRVRRDAADLRAVARSVSELELGTLDIVSLATLAVDPVASLVGRFRQSHPGIMIRMREPDDPAGVERAVASGNAEIGFTDLVGGAQAVQRIELFRQEVVAVSPPGTTSQDPLSPHELAALALVVTPSGTSTRRLLDRTLRRIGSEPTVAVEVSYREALVPLVLAGAGTALLPRSMAEVARTQGAVVRELRPKVSRRIVAVHRSGALSPAAAALLEMASAHLTGSGTQPRRSRARSAR